MAQESKKTTTALNEATPIPSDKDLKVGCAVCCVNFLHAPEFDWRGVKSNQEVFNYLEVLAKERGWAYEFDGPSAVKFICPACRAKDDTVKAVILPKYKEKAACKACGNASVATRYCEGINKSVCRFGPRAHLHRVCGRCGYDWIEGCLNDPLTE